MALGISNLVIGALLLAAALWQHAARDAAAGGVTSFVVAGAGALGVGAYQLWRHRYVYNHPYGDDV